MRLFLAVLVLIGLCACKPKPAADAANAEPENAWSQFPLYRKAAAASTSMRPGVWVGVDPKCPFLEAESTGVWPTCAQFMVVRPRMLITHHSGDSLELLTTQSYLMIDGYPRILQLAEGLGRTPYWFRYEGLRPLASDPDGSITRARLWNVTCGSAPANEAAPAASAAGRQIEGHGQPTPGPPDRRLGLLRRGGRTGARLRQGQPGLGGRSPGRPLGPRRPALIPAGHVVGQPAFVGGPEFRQGDLEQVA